MADDRHAQLVSTVSREIVARQAPQELPLFSSFVEAYQKDPQQTTKGQVSGDELLGFGVGEVVTFVTPFVLSVMTSVVMFLSKEVVKSVTSQAPSTIDDAVKLLFTKFRSATKDPQHLPPPLTKAQLEQVHAIATQQARQLGLSDSHARLLADSVAGSLAVA